MKILILHNEYQVRGGEDVVVEKQFDNLTNKRSNVKKYIINNSDINSYSKLKKVFLFIKNAMLSKTDKELLFYIDDYKPDIVHIHNVYPLINPRIYYELNIRGIKIVQTLHNYRFLCPNGLFFQKEKVCEECLEYKSVYRCYKNSCYRDSKLESFWYSRMISLASKRKYFECINKFISLNGFMKDKMIDNGYNKDKFEIIPNGIEYKESDILDKEDYYLYIGRLSDEKGISTLCKALSNTNKKLYIIGTGPLEDNIKKISNEIHNIEYFGFKSGEKKDEFVAKAKAIIVPSEWYENLPTVIIEAFMVKTPVIVSKLGGAQYMVEEGYNGVKFEAGNQNDLLNALDRFEQLDQKVLQENSLTTYFENYESDLVTEKLITLYKDLISDTK